MADAKSFDVEKVRADFPILAKEVYGKPLVYLDNAASAQKPRQVIERMKTAYETEYANVHRGLHYLANAATEAFEGARESVRRFLNAPSSDQIIFTRSATEAINLVASSFGLNGIGEGDEIILSLMEHHSNIVPWHFHRERKGAVIKWVPVDDDGAFDLEAFKKLLSPRTKIVAITHMSNVLGTITPIREIIKLAGVAGAGIVAAVVALPLRGLFRAPGPPMEEGFMLVFPERMMRGDVPNVDFLHLYGPGSLHVLSVVYQLFGASMTVERTVGAVYALAAALALAVSRARGEESMASTRTEANGVQICP